MIEASPEWFVVVMLACYGMVELSYHATVIVLGRVGVGTDD